ncbi:MAG TPA: DUF3419 family protein [Gemmatimonadaceae bacterium]|nr:DUF3419 family protein [Gemmatimonadaceae bacterium]
MTAAVTALPPRSVRKRYRVRRRSLESAQSGKLYFAQVREDPLLEIDALAAGSDDTVVIVGSGGCTALSLLAAGAGRVVAVDLNATQTNVIELKAAAVASLDLTGAASFLGAFPMERAERRAIYSTLRTFMSPTATSYWNANAGMIEKGVMGAGVSERFITALAAIVRNLVHSRERIDRLLACKTLAEQRCLYDREWNNRRWRALFSMLMNRRSFSRTYDPGFFANVENPSFSRHFQRLLEHALCDVPVSTNYFLHHMLNGTYPAATPGGLPPYLDRTANQAIETGLSGLELVDGAFQEYLSLCGDSSVDAIAMSNICEWLPPGEVDGLFAEVIRVARPGARVCFRNFVGHTEVPEQFRSVLVEDVDRGRAAIRRDRSCVQARIAMCTVEK